jgi:cold shock CspA family protein
LTPDGWPARRTARIGIVTSFEEARGLGTVADESGSTFDFHCTAITDASRDIEVGRGVEFVVRPGHRGRLEAGLVVKR